MLGAESVFGGVAIWRTVTTKRGLACLTSAQVHPLRAQLEAFLAHATGSWFNLCNRFYVLATFRIHGLLLLMLTNQEEE